ncbi:hypothetical protein KBX06_17155 [Micromonospora sp. C31]|nr:hypothetical protein [Micromonospora sp. C31]
METVSRRWAAKPGVALVELAQHVPDAGRHRLAGPLGLVAEASAAAGQPGGGAQLGEQGTPLGVEVGHPPPVAASGSPVDLVVEPLQVTPVTGLGPAWRRYRVK